MWQPAIRRILHQNYLYKVKSGVPAAFSFSWKQRKLQLQFVSFFFSLFLKPTETIWGVA
jgi:hypothetical protein